MPENMENAVFNRTETDDEPIELEVQVIKASPIVRAALEFYSLRCGQSIEEYCARAILTSLQSDEESTNGTFLD